ncbi:alpha/beta hydrolase fold domain-containing protein [Microbacterium sp. NEAU-LLC]|uniref:Alpha/beta hydrolase fold domain-containing protein n=1 Tax=Microbacterium helvum TaxID=2773713 RepID=A0ABR8NSC0_9MICO|nr:alpha/beta hydrolase fold domain-containing protein [Microbacterium helvum]MBD3943510.1 alpha/beta hydrolase fold domain-containing protein [Microbacterium helvum]
MTRLFVPELEARRHLLDGYDDHPSIPQSVVDQWKAPFGPAEEWDLSVTDEELPGPHGPVPVRVYTPRGPVPDGGRACLVWMHGGAFVWGDLDMPEAHEVARGVAGRADAVVISVHYRRCPVPPELNGTIDGRVDELGQPVRFPVPQDDCAAVLDEVRAGAARFGVDPARIAVGGASAGASLAASATLRAARAGRAPWQTLLVYPLVHPELPAPDDELAEALAAVPTALQIPRWMHDAIQRTTLGDVDRPREEDFTPGISDSLGLFPPTYVENCEFDALRSSGQLFSEQLRTAGVDVVESMRAGVPHGHLDLVGFRPAAETLDALAARLRETPAQPDVARDLQEARS